MANALTMKIILSEISKLNSAMKDITPDNPDYTFIDVYVEGIVYYMLLTKLTYKQTTSILEALSVVFKNHNVKNASDYDLLRLLAATFDFKTVKLREERANLLIKAAKILGEFSYTYLLTINAYNVGSFEVFAFIYPHLSDGKDRGMALTEVSSYKNSYTFTDKQKIKALFDLSNIIQGFGLRNEY